MEIMPDEDCYEVVRLQRQLAPEDFDTPLFTSIVSNFQVDRSVNAMLN